MRLHCFQHVPFEDLGSIRSWADASNFSIRTTRFYAGDPLPEADDLDWLVVMGGPMGASDEAKYPWLKPEKAFIRSAIDAGKVVLGICLGAQLIAGAMGAAVYPNPNREIGWFDVRKTTADNSVPALKAFPEKLNAFHWHGDTFDLPEGSIHLAASDGCRHQGFAINRRVVGLQFHLETTPESLEKLIANCASELTQGPFIQTPEEMRSHPERFREINRAMEILLDALAHS